MARDWRRNQSQPVKVNRDAVWLEGGPRDGWCYYADDLDQKVRCADAMGVPFPYRPTDRMNVHPGNGNAVLTVWGYTG